MLKWRQLSMGLFFVLLLSTALFAQNELIMPPPTTGTEFLNEQIQADHDAVGNPDRIYVLQRDGIYLFNGILTNNGWALRIKAEEGEGAKPIIYLVVNSTTGTFPARFIQMGEDVWFKDIVLVGFLETQADQFANDPPRLIQTQTAGFDLVLDGCVLTSSRGEHIRLEQATRLTKITNCIFGNMGDLGTSNLGAGKPIDFRNASCDSAIFVNNTFVNFQDRIVRHRASAAAINYFLFDHNTCVNSMGYHGTIVLGWTGDEAIITNNLFLDTFVAGADTDKVRQSEFEESGELDPRNTLGRMVWILNVPNDSTDWKVSGNYYSVSPEVQAFYDAHAAEGVTGEGPALTYHINSMLGPDSVDAFIKEYVELTNRPAPMVNMAEWYRAPDGGNKTKSTTGWDRATDDYDRRLVQYYTDTLDCTYPHTTAAFIGAEKAYPAGDLNWYPAWKVRWEDGEDLTAVEPNGTSPERFALKQNYPNPFNPTTQISFTLNKAGKTTLTVYNMLGQKMATLVDTRLSQGSQEVSFDASSLASGVYYYKLESGNQISIKKMVFLK